MSKISEYDELDPLDDDEDELVLVDTSVGTNKRTSIGALISRVFTRWLGSPKQDEDGFYFEDPDAVVPKTRGWRNFNFSTEGDTSFFSERYSVRNTSVLIDGSGTPEGGTAGQDDSARVIAQSYNENDTGRAAYSELSSTTGDTTVGMVAKLDLQAGEGGGLSRVVLNAYNTYGSLNISGGGEAAVKLNGPTCYIDMDQTDNLAGSNPGGTRTRFYAKGNGELMHHAGVSGPLRVNDAHMRHHSGLWYAQPNGPGGVNADITQDRIYYYPFYAPWATEYDAFTMNVTATNSGASYSVGVYTDNSGIPGDLLFDGGTYDAATMGGGNPTLNTNGNFTLSGWNWIAMVCNTNTITVSFQRWVSHLGVVSPYSYSEAGSYYQDGVTGLPATFVDGGSFSPRTDGPGVWLRSA